ncbi:MAG: hypothetical protein JXO22_11550 [Phycisphaerae bacterium]|nr:hypothetical protein [Phycisphaerae bacterium]
MRSKHDILDEINTRAAARNCTIDELMPILIEVLIDVRDQGALNHAALSEVITHLHAWCGCGPGVSESSDS